MIRVLFCSALLAFAGSAHPAGWVKETLTDPLTGKAVARQFSTSSTNTIELRAPYDGGTTGTLRVLLGGAALNRPSMLSISKGQFVCALSGCAVRVRFDEAPPVIVNAKPPSDGSPDVLMLDSWPFQQNIPEGNLIQIEATFYQSGSQVLRFEMPGGMRGAVEKPKGEK